MCTQLNGTISDKNPLFIHTLPNKVSKNCAIVVLGNACGLTIKSGTTPDLEVIALYLLLEEAYQQYL